MKPPPPIPLWYMSMTPTQKTVPTSCLRVNKRDVLRMETYRVSSISTLLQKIDPDATTDIAFACDCATGIGTLIEAM